MAELLTTKEMLAALENIIKKAEKYICIFTYNIKIDQNYLSRLRNASKRGVSITIVFGVDNGDPEIIEAVLRIPQSTVYFNRNLHAKFFFNEKQLLVGSMNLSEASARNNFELGVLFAGQEYQDVIEKVREEAREITSEAKRWSDLKRSLNADSTTNQAGLTEGSCIRCGWSIPFNPTRPLCPKCFSEWSEWENEFYQEIFCHRCRKERMGISYAYPQCPSCFKDFVARSTV